MIVNPEIERYIDGLLPERHSVLLEMEALAAEKKIPIVGPAVGSILAQLVMISGAKRIFELGSAIGYSTIWLAQAAGADAEIHYSDGSSGNARLAEGFFQRAGLESRIQVHVGDALTSLRESPGEYDMIFNDVDKQGYLAVLDAVPVRLKSGGLFVTDNALWHEKVLSPEDDTSRTVVNFDRNIFENKGFMSTLLPVRDGLLISLKR